MMAAIDTVTDAIGCFSINWYRFWFWHVEMTRMQPSIFVAEVGKEINVTIIVSVKIFPGLVGSTNSAKALLHNHFYLPLYFIHT